MDTKQQLKDPSFIHYLALQLSPGTTQIKILCNNEQTSLAATHIKQCPTEQNQQNRISKAALSSENIFVNVSHDKILCIKAIGVPKRTSVQQELFKGGLQAPKAFELLQILYLGKKMLDVAKVTITQISFKGDSFATTELQSLLRQRATLSTAQVHNQY